MISQVLQPQVNTASEPPIYFMGVPTLLRATSRTTNGAFGLVESVLPPGFASPYHTHRLEDEAFYVVEGEMAFVCGDSWTLAGPGTYVFGPRGIAHGFKVVGDAPARLLLLCTPGGFEQFVVDLSEPSPAPPDMAKIAAVAARYGIDVHGPLPDGPAETGSTSLKQAVAKTRAQHIAAVNANDVDAALRVLAPDAIMLPPGQPVLQGASIRVWFEHVFANFRVQGFDLEPAGLDERGSIAVEHGSWRATFDAKDGSAALPAGGTYLTIYARLGDGGVRIVRDAFNGLP